MVELLGLAILLHMVFSGLDLSFGLAFPKSESKCARAQFYSAEATLDESGLS